MKEQAKRACLIEQVGKNRAGKPRFWCSVHQSPATGRYGARLPECEAAHREINFEKVTEINVEDYPGGVGIWGAVAPAYDTTGQPQQKGVHLHARKLEGGKKDIDETVEAVRLSYRKDLLDRGESLITSETAVNFYLSRFLKRKIKHLFCIHCGELHLDADYYAVKPHRKHLCHACGKYFNDEERAVSNPIALLREKGDIPVRDPIRPDRAISLRQADYPGGVVIWGSNPALLWTAARPEDEGLHLHAYDAAGKEALNDTYSEIKLDGVLLNEEQVKQYMAQASLLYLKGKIVSLSCPQCGSSLFDRGEKGFYPKSNHHCDICGHNFKSHKRVVINPFVDMKATLLASHGTGGN